MTAQLLAAGCAQGRRKTLAAVLSGMTLLTACQTRPPAQPLPPPAAIAPAASIVALLEKPAERALVNGLRHYEEGAFDRAEQGLRSALQLGLQNPQDAASAHKYLAFIACAFNRAAECEQHFRNAFSFDRRFALRDSEIGHPVWGPVYRKVAAQVRLQ